MSKEIIQTRSVDPQLIKQSPISVGQAVAENAANLPDTLQVVTIVDITSGIKDKAIDYADRRVAHETSQPGFRGFINKIWRGNIARDYYRQKYINYASRTITETDNHLAMHGGTAVDHHRSGQSIVKRFVTDYVHWERGEQQNDILSVDGGSDLRDKVYDLIDQFSKGTIVEADLIDKKDQLLKQFGQLQNKQNIKLGKMYVDNIVEVAQQAKAMMRHNAGLAAIDQVIFNVGIANPGVCTKSHMNKVDRLVSNAQTTKLGSMVNEATLGLGIATIMAFGKYTTNKLISAAAMTTTLGVGLGLISGVRESVALQHERRLHNRQMAEGGIISPANSQRRQKLEDSRFSAVSANDLISDLNSSITLYKNSGTTDSYDNFLKELVRTESLIRLSNQHDVDLISYDSVLTVEDQRLELDITHAKAMVLLKQIKDNLSNDEITTLEDQLQDLHQDREMTVMTRLSELDSKFKSYKRSRVVRAIGIGALSGIILGVVSQDIRSYFTDRMLGLFGYSKALDNRRTELAALFARHNFKQLSVVHKADLANKITIGNHVVEMPAGVRAVYDSTTHQYKLFGPHNRLLTDNFNPNNLSALHRYGLIGHTTKNLNNNSSTAAMNHANHALSNAPLSPDTYISQHPSRFTAVDRQFWYNNNTPNVYDYNELALDWGGLNGSGLDASHNFVLNVSHMTANGSFYGNQSVNYQQAIQGHQLFVALSVNQANQNNVLLVPVNGQGNAIFNHNDPLIRSLFQNNGGQSQYLGAYAECVQLIGKNAQGADIIRPLATIVGSNNPLSVVAGSTMPSNSHVLAASLPQMNTRLSLLGSRLVTNHLPTEIAPAIPLYGRAGLEDITAVDLSERHDSQPELREIAKDVDMLHNVSPRLQEKPNCILDPSEEIAWYMHRLKEDEPDTYKEVLSQLEHSKLPDNLAQVTDAIINIPIFAHQIDEEQIKKVLSLYDQQSEQWKRDQSAIVLHVFWPEAALSDNMMIEKIEKTKQAITRSQQLFPDLQILAIESTLANNLNQLIVPSYVERRMQDLTMAALDISYQKGHRAADQDILVVRNNSNMSGMSRIYMDSIVTAYHKQRAADAFSGIVRTRVQHHVEEPEAAVLSNFKEILRTLRARNDNNQPVELSEDNYAYRASSVAALGLIKPSSRTSESGQSNNSFTQEIAYRLFHSRQSLYGNLAKVIKMEQAKNPTTNQTYPTNSTDNKGRKGIAIRMGRAVVSQAEQSSSSTIRFVSSTGVDVMTPETSSKSAANKTDFSKMNKDEIIQFAETLANSITEIARQHSVSESQLRLALKLMFPEKNSNNQLIYSLIYDKEGKPSINFSDQGAIWLFRRLWTGKSYRRTVRNLYHIVSSIDKEPPITSRPRFVQ